jgi:hypothetical protein
VYTKSWFDSHEKKRPLERLKLRWRDNIIINLRTNRLRGCGLDSSGSGQELLAESCKHDNQTSASVKEDNFSVI